MFIMSHREKFVFVSVYATKDKLINYIRPDTKLRFLEKVRTRLVRMYKALMQAMNCET